MGAGAIPTLLFTGVQAGYASDAAWNQSQAIKYQGEYRQKVAGINEKVSDINAQDAIAKGEKQANAYRSGVKKLVGKQRARLAAQGLDAGSGTADDIIGSTQTMGELDALTISNNAQREAFGFKMQARQASLEGKFAQQSADAESRATLLTGGINALNIGISGAASAFGSYADSKKAKASK